ncbi:MAG TPA: hypothetical protein VGM03_08635 [Phycisphaerae bacterium]
MKRTVPLLITAAGGIVLIVSFFVPYTESWGEDATMWFDILAAIAFVLGGGNLLRMHLRKVLQQQAGWGFSAITVISFVVTLGVGLLKVGVPPAENFPNHAWSGVYNAEESAFGFAYEYVFKPLTATIFSLLAFYVASAAFRAFRAKNIEALLLLGTAFLILLGRTFAGALLTAWLPERFSEFTIPELTVTIMNVFVAAGNRAIMIGIALGIASISLRVILGIDRSYLGKE